MFFKYFLGLCVFVFFAVVISVSAEEDDTDEGLEERANPAVTIVIKIIAKLFKGAAAKCLGEAGNLCKGHWKHPKAALQCAENFLKQNKGRCAVGK